MAPAKKRRLIAAADAAFAINDGGDGAMMTMTMMTAEAAVAVADVGMVPAPPSTSSTAVAAPSTVEGGRRNDYYVDDDDDDRKRIIVARLLDRHVETVNLIRRDVSALLLASSAPAAATTDDVATNMIETLAPSISTSLSKLKSLQRQITLQSELSYAESRRRRDACDNLGLSLMNVTYERDYLRDEIAEIGGWRARSLESMALGELGIDGGAFVNDGMGVASSARSHAVPPPTTAISSSFEEGEEVEGEGGGVGDDVRGKDEASSTSVRDVGSEITTLEGAIDAYLFGSDENDGVATTSVDDGKMIHAGGGRRSHRDPSEHSYVVEKLTSDLTARANLVELLSKAKLELRGTIKRRDELLGLLDKFPARLAELRRAGEGLNSLFFGGNVGVWQDVLIDVGGGGGGGDDDDDMIIDGGNGEGDGKRTTTDAVSAANLLVCRPSFDRTERFRLAKSNLPSPLYVLYVQLAGYLDAWSSLQRLGEGRGMITTAGGIVNSVDASSSSSSNISCRGFVGAGGMDVSVIPPSECGGGGGWSVALTLTPSEVVPSEVLSLTGKTISNPRSSLVPTMAAVVKIVFSIDVMHGVVRAMLLDGGDGYDGLLDNLFPGDDGLYNPNVSLALLSHDEDGNASDGEKNRANGGRTIGDDCNVGGAGKPYYWCQVLGGLDFPPPPTAIATPGSAHDDAGRDDAPFPIETCTRAVFRQLLRRIRARRTLAAILEFISKRGNQHTLPVHPAMRRKDGGVVAQSQSPRAKLHSWGEDPRPDRSDLSGVASTATKSYTAIIKRKSSTLKARVVIDAHNYPAKPPVWSLINEDGASGTLSSWGGENESVFSLQQQLQQLHKQQQNSNNDTNGVPPLFDATLHRIECRVNLELDRFVRQDLETTFDWILIHQLADIVSCWDEVMNATEGIVGGAGLKGEREVPCNGRTRRGKDRRIVGFGERSPFFRYRNGL
jgi:hypothetical protein